MYSQIRYSPIWMQKTAPRYMTVGSKLLENWFYRLINSIELICLPRNWRLPMRVGQCAVRSLTVTGPTKCSCVISNPPPLLRTRQWPYCQAEYGRVKGPWGINWIDYYVRTPLPHGMRFRRIVVVVYHAPWRSTAASVVVVVESLCLRMTVMSVRTLKWTVCWLKLYVGSGWRMVHGAPLSLSLRIAWWMVEF